MARKAKERSVLGAVKAIGPVRIVSCLLLALVGGWLAVTLTISGIARYNNPQAVLMVMPGDSAALAARADQLLAADPTNPPPQVQRLATQALRQQAMNAKAVRILGYAADAKGDRPRALALLQMAERLSRREPGTQLWLIEYHAQANDTIKTLKHYDNLLKIKPDTQGLLFPRLSNAISDASIRTALLPHLHQDKLWMSLFLWHAIGNDKDLTHIVNLISENGGFPKNRAGDNSSREQEKRLLGRLVAEGRFADARHIYALVPGTVPTILTSPSFTPDDRTGRFGAMGWQLFDEPNAGGGFGGGQGKAKTSLQVFANAATTQQVATKLLYLQPGNYRLTVKFDQFERGDGGFVQLRMRCPTKEGAAPLWSFNVEPARGEGQFAIPANCTTQFLDIIASGGQGQLGLEAVIGSIAIEQ